MTKSLENNDVACSSSNRDNDKDQNTTSLALTNFMRTYIPSVFLKEETLREYQFIIPLHERSNQNFWDLFAALEENKVKLKIDSYGIHDVSLEEIFLKAAQLKSSEHAEEVKLATAKATNVKANEKSVEDDDPLLENPESDNENELSLNEEINSTFSSHYKQEKSLYELDYIYADLEKGYRLYFKQVYSIVVKR